MLSCLKIAAVACLSAASVVGAAIPAGYTGKPYSGDTLLGKPQQVPGVVKGIFVDSGGASLTFNACCALQGYAGYDYDILGYGTNGQNDSSVNATPPTSHLSYMVAGQWMKYTVHVNTAGTYYVDVKLATVGSPNLQTLTYYNGAWVKSDSFANLPVCQTPPGCPEPWHAWNVNMGVDSIALDTGLQVVQITFNEGSWNYDWMRFRLAGASATRRAAAALGSQNPGFTTALSGEKLTLSYKARFAAARISMINCSGRTVLSFVDNNNAPGSRCVNVNVGNLRRGVYFITVEQNGNRATQSLTIAR